MTKADKQALRKEMRTRKRLFSQLELGEKSLSAVERLLANERVGEAHTLLLYAPLPDEVDVSPLLERLGDRTLLLPKVTGEGTMELRHYTAPGDMAVGAYGISEPMGKVFTDHEAIDVAIVPGMAFDRHGHRLGRGKGYYDRFLARCANVYKIGVCFDFQLVDAVPTDADDIAMDEVVCTGQQNLMSKMT